MMDCSHDRATKDADVRGRWHCPDCGIPLYKTRIPRSELKAYQCPTRIKTTIEIGGGAVQQSRVCHNPGVHFGRENGVAVCSEHYNPRTNHSQKKYETTMKRQQKRIDEITEKSDLEIKRIRAESRTNALSPELEVSSEPFYSGVVLL